MTLPNPSPPIFIFFKAGTNRGLLLFIIGKKVKHPKKGGIRRFRNRSLLNTLESLRVYMKFGQLFPIKSVIRQE